MSTLEYSPGPNADHAFRLGLLSSLIAAVTVLVYLLWSGWLSTHEAVFYAVAGLPIVLILASCVLAVWLGYDNRSLV